MIQTPLNFPPTAKDDNVDFDKLPKLESHLLCCKMIALQNNINEIVQYNYAYPSFSTTSEIMDLVKVFDLANFDYPKTLLKLMDQEEEKEIRLKKCEEYLEECDKKTNPTLLEKAYLLVKGLYFPINENGEIKEIKDRNLLKKLILELIKERQKHGDRISSIVGSRIDLFEFLAIVLVKNDFNKKIFMNFAKSYSYDNRCDQKLASGYLKIYGKENLQEEFFKRCLETQDLSNGTKQKIKNILAKLAEENNN